MTFPTVRLLRNRQTKELRNILAETALHKSDLIMPFFINETLQEKKAVEKMPGICQHSFSSLLPEVERIVNLGLSSVILFGIPEEKDPHGNVAFHSHGVIQKAIQEIKKHFPHLIVIADCCLCEYTSGGHCGIMEEGKLNNDATLASLQKVALSYAESGVDIIAPSGMMDGMVQAIRAGLDAHHHEMVPIMSYAVKYASQFYGPFRDAAGSSGDATVDRKVHQLDPRQSREAVREALLDVEEGADYLMVKPALPYLDMIYQVKTRTLLPVVAYQVSGEYAMLKLAAKQGLFQEWEVFYETLIGIKRAGADLIISYYADEIAKRLN